MTLAFIWNPLVIQFYWISHFYTHIPRRLCVSDKECVKLTLQIKKKPAAAASIQCISPRALDYILRLCLQIKHSFHIARFFHLTLNAPITAGFLQSKRLDKSAEWISPRKYPLTVTFCGSLSVNARRFHGECVLTTHKLHSSSSRSNLGQDKLKGRSHNQRWLAWNSAACRDIYIHKKRTDEKRGKRMRAVSVQNTPSRTVGLGDECWKSSQGYRYGRDGVATDLERMLRSARFRDLIRLRIFALDVVLPHKVKSVLINYK